MKVKSIPVRLLSFFLMAAFALNGCAQSAPPTSTPLLTQEPVILTTATNMPTAQPTATRFPPTIHIGAQNLPWWNDTTFYEIFVRSFFDSNGDGIGDFNGIIQKLDYLNDGNPQTHADLGVTGIWLMPIFPASSYHGYDVTDYLSVNPQYGTMDDFKRLLAEAHKRGIRVILDLVLNHTSSKHPWFLSAQQGPQSPYRDFYLWSEKDPGWKGPNGETVWHTSNRGEAYYGYFGAGMPDLNYTNPQVTQEMEKITRFWLQDVGVDGFRLDAAKYLIEEGKTVQNTPATHAWFQGFRAFYKGVSPRVMMVGEVWDKTQIAASYAQGDQLDLTFDFDLANAWLLAVTGKDSHPPNFMLKRDLALYPPAQFATFLANHDQNRVMSQVNGDGTKAKLAAALLLTSPGVPFIYYGEEIGMTGQKPDEQIRTPMQWNAGYQAGFTPGKPWEDTNPDFTTANVQAEDSDPQSLLNFYRQMLRLRSEHAALRTGSTFVLESNNGGVYAVLRADAQEAVLVVINLRTEAVKNYRLSLAKGPLAGNFPVTPLVGSGSFPTLSANAAGGFDSYQPLAELPPGSVTILSLKP